MSAPSRPRQALAAAVLTLLCVVLLLGAVGPGGDASVSVAAAQDVATPTGCRHEPGASQVRRGPAGAGKRVALTFDDGPGALTGSFLKVLAREDVPATFFVVGRGLAGREATVRRTLAAGHDVGNHSFTHANLKAADDAVADELSRTQDAIRGATGYTPCLFRPPFGVSNRALVALAGNQGLTSVLWSVYPQDTRRPAAKTIRRRVLDAVRPGSIVLLHDGGGDRSQTLAALPGIIRSLKSRGYTFVTLTDLLGRAVTR